MKSKAYRDASNKNQETPGPLTLTSQFFPPYTGIPKKGITFREGVKK
jgi:hypothetical protein